VDPYNSDEDTGPMISQELIQAIADDREKEIADELRRRLVRPRRSLRWIRHHRRSAGTPLGWEPGTR
jgi:hypothetical protein